MNELLDLNGDELMQWLEAAKTTEPQ